MSQRTRRRWYQFTIWHMLVAMTVLGVGVSVVLHMLKPEPVEVQGIVMVGGKPLSSGVITFVSADVKKKRVSQRISNGKYALSDPIESGVYLVEISSPKTTGNVAVETLPPYFNSNTSLTVQLLPGENQLDFDLSSRLSWTMRCDR